MLLRQEPAQAFRTRRVRLVCSEKERFEIQPFGSELSFDQVQSLRQPLAGSFSLLPGSSLDLANLGVSLNLTCRVGGEDYLALVPQRRNDGLVLKLVSGYVPVEHLNNPWLTVRQELSEEILPASEKGYGRITLAGEALDDFYGLACDLAMNIDVEPGASETSQISVCGQALPKGTSFYVHQPTSSLQLVFNLKADIPEGVTLRHVEDCLSSDAQMLEARLYQDDRLESYVVLAKLNAQSEPGGFFTLQNGQIKPFMADEKICLSEYFARQNCVSLRNHISYQ